MELERIRWSQAKQKNLEGQLTNFWATDEWHFGECPLIHNCTEALKIHYQKPVRFDCISPTLNAELKYACWQKLERREWSPKSLWTKRSAIRCITGWLNLVAPRVSSLMERSLESWILSFRSYLLDQGVIVMRTRRGRLSKNQEIPYFRQENQNLTLFRQIYKIVQDAYDDRLEYDKEVWDVRRMGVPYDNAKSNYRINFANITQPWLLYAAKEFIKYSLSICSLGECQSRVAMLRDFSSCLAHNYPLLHPSKIDRQIIRDFLVEYSFTGLSEATRQRQISCLRAFLELSAREGWAEIPDKRFIYSEDIPQSRRTLPRFIPEEVMDQLNQHLEELPDNIMRMVLVIQEAGMRIGELCKLSFNCLTQDVQGDWFLRYYQFKMKKEHTIPISSEVVAVIREQQKVTQQQWGENPSYLFLNNKGLPIKQETFTRNLNQLAYAKEIRDAAGQLWHFQSHQFRHTVGTRMINAKVPHHIVQRFLGHVSPEMTNRYAFIHDATLKEEFAKFKDKIVDITGRFVQYEEILAEISEGSEPNGLDEQWLKKHVLTQALPNGICGLPAVQKFCPYGANKCYSCTHFKTDARYLSGHEEHLERTEKIIAWAQEHPESSRSHDLLKENLPVKEGLERIIAAIKGQAR